MSATDPHIPDSMVDGATGIDDGGREAGDVELAIFRRIRSISNVSGKLFVSGSGNGYRRYLPDPLSMFSPESQGDLSGAERKSTESGGEGLPSGSGEEDTEKEEEDDDGDEPDDDEEDSSAGLEQYVSHGVAWRDAMVQACADLLGKTLDELNREFNATRSVADASLSAFGENRSFEPVPRDLADYAIMSTLKLQDALAMQNATSWLFNMMDRTGAGYVLRDEFVRYAPFIGPVADAAVAGLVFDELVKEQARLAAEKETANGKEGEKMEGQLMRDNVRIALRGAGEGLRRRRRLLAAMGRVGANQSTPDQPHVTPPANAPDNPVKEVAVRELYPPAAALRYETWRPFFLAIQDKYHCNDDDWVNIKQDLGIDPGEILVKSQGALDHSDVFPTLGKLYLSQRYLIFYAAVGRNHYVVRLGAVAEVKEAAIPIMMRDCIQIFLESEAKAALDGVSALQKEAHEEVGAAKKGKNGEESDVKQESTLSEYVGNLMRKFSAGRKPLLFSLLEFRETKRRDNWMRLTKELVAAHKLHVQLGFGSSGRAVPSVQSPQATPTESIDGITKEVENEEAKKIREMKEIRTRNYTRSPFRNEQSPPLLVVAAHGNIVRYRALRRVTKKRVSPSILLFSRADVNVQLITWYTDSVRAYDNQSGKSWIERALSAIRENMDTNDRMYRVNDDEPFDVAILGDAIGRFAELCSPLARVVQFISLLFQWRNPPATILAILVCVSISFNGLVNYVPAFLIFFQAAWVVETKYNWLGLGMGLTESEDAERRQANVLALVAQVHDTLAAAQNVLGTLNRELGKVQSLFLWGSEEWQSWAAVGALCLMGFVLLIMPSRILFLGTVFFLFFKHFLPPTNIVLQYWQSIPSRIGKKEKTTRREGRRKRSKASTPRTFSRLSSTN